MQAHLVTAPGDGVAPGVLLTLPGSSGGSGPPGSRGAQYLFNVPEGFSRLVLEHKLRPGAGLQAVFASDAAALAGFGGLLMRLRGEGHDQLHVMGPRGTQAMVSSLRHFIHWRHPAVLVEEVSPWEQPTVYQDGHISVAALWKPPLMADMWPCPSWLLHPQQSVQPAVQTSLDATSSGASEGSSSESNDGSSGSSESDDSGSSSSSDGDASSNDADGRGDGSSSDENGGSERRQQADMQPGGGAQPSMMFEALDKLFMSRQGRSKTLVLEQLKVARESAAGALCGVTAAPLPTAVRTQAAAAAKSAAAAAAPRRRQQPASSAAGREAAGQAADVVVICGKRFQQMPAQSGINAWLCQKLALKAASAGPQPDTRRQPARPAAGSTSGPAAHAGPAEHSTALAFLCHIKASDQLLLVTNVHSKGAAAQLQQHPATAFLLDQRDRLAGVLHLAAAGVAGSKAFRQLCCRLQPAVAAGPAGGKQLLMEHPGPRASLQMIGHLASARTSSKLSLISSCIFPLPAGVKAPTSDGQSKPLTAAENGHREGSSEDGIKHKSSSTVAQHAHTQREAQDDAASRACEEHTQAQVAAEALAAAANLTNSSSTAGGSSDEVLHIRHVSLASWQQQSAIKQVNSETAVGADGSLAKEQQAMADANADSAGKFKGPTSAVLAVEPLEGFSGGVGFDAGAVQQEVQQEKPQLLAALEQLRLQQQDGLLPPSEQLSADVNAGWPCRNNTVAAPPPPPPPQAAMQAAQLWQGWAAPGHMQQLQMPAAQQAHQPSQPRIMRPLYYQQPAPMLHQQQQLPAVAGQQLWAALQQQPWHLAQAAAIPGQSLPPPLQQLPPQPQQCLDEPSGQEDQQRGQAIGSNNKRAADNIRARLQGSKRPRPQADSATISREANHEQQRQHPGGAAFEQQQQEHHEGAAAGRQLWLQDAPSSICQLAERGTGAVAGVGPEVVFLGTGSAEPSKYRGASAIQLRLPCGQSLLVDCGEGTLGALCRTYGTAAALRQVASLGCVWVSHRHADHMSGVLSLLAAYPASLPPLLLVGPRSLRDWLAEAAPALRQAGRYRFVHSSELNQPGHWARHALQRHLGIQHLECVPVRHCSDAYGLVLRHEQGWSLVYSGDTQPCQQLVQAGQGCTLLIHEATFEPCLEQQARQKRHSTTAEALEVARRMGAYRCILTHFSQRYPKWPEGLPQIQGSARPAEDQVAGGIIGQTAELESGGAGATAAVAFDGMRVPLRLLPVLPLLMPAVRAALADAGEGNDVVQDEGDLPAELHEASPGL